METVLIFELANHGNDEISISELNEKLKKRAIAWGLFSRELQNILISAQQANVISIFKGSMKLTLLLLKGGSGNKEMHSYMF